MKHTVSGTWHQQTAHKAAGRCLVSNHGYQAGASDAGSGCSSSSSGRPAAASPCTTVPDMCHPSPVQQRQSSSAVCSCIGRRSWLLAGVAGVAAAALPAAAPPAQAAITITLRAKPQMKQYNLDGGYSITVPDTWALAYVSSWTTILTHPSCPHQAAPRSRMASLCCPSVGGSSICSWLTPLHVVTATTRIGQRRTRQACRCCLATSAPLRCAPLAPSAPQQHRHRLAALIAHPVTTP